MNKGKKIQRRLEERQARYEHNMSMPASDTRKSLGEEGFHRPGSHKTRSNGR